MVKSKLSLLSLSLIALTACESGPKYVRPKIDMPKLKGDCSKCFTEKWWEVFNSSVLNQLEEKAIANNSDLQQAIENIEISQAQVETSIGDMLPSLSALLSGGESRVSTKENSYNPQARSRTFFSYTGQLNASYEIDLFGEYRSATRSARALLLTTKAAKQTVFLAVTAQVAKCYFTIRSLEAKLQIAKRTLKTRQESFDVYQNRYKNGYCTQLDFLRVKSELYAVKITVASLEKALAGAETSLSVLIGCSPKEMYGWKLPPMKAINRLNIAVKIPEGIPADILTRRPDVIAAEGQLIAANAEIGKAMAANFPSLSLTSSFGFASKSLSSLFVPSADTFQFGAGLGFPIFAGGKISAMTKAAEASYRKQLTAYKHTVQVAFKEALDALTEYHINSEIVKSRTIQVEALKKSYSIAKSQKDVGMIGLLDLLDVERGLLATEIELVDSQLNKLNAIIDVCKSFGAGWTANKLRRK